MLALDDVEQMALRGALINLFPPLTPEKLKAFESERDRGVDILVRQFEREDGVLNTIEVRERLRENIKIIDRFGQVRKAVLAIVANRADRSPMPEERKLLLPAIIQGAVFEAETVGLSAYAEWVQLAAYCAAIVHGPDFYRLPIDAPAGVMRPLGYVPSITELRPVDEGR